MAGHSKWANIRHKKERADKQKGKIFSRMAKEIITAVKAGGDDPRSNPRLRLAIQKAKASNVPNDVIDRNIKKAMNPDTAAFMPMTYEIYGHGGVGIIVEILSDNKNRVASEMRIATNKKGGNIAEPGSVAFNFDRKGVIQIAKNGQDEEELFQIAIDCGAEDFEASEEGFMVITEPTELDQVREALVQKGVEIAEAEIEMLPKLQIECDQEIIEANQALIDWLEELDDVTAVYHNMDV
jgi:YebC/PmpR family DNA-binding regulatory protein